MSESQTAPSLARTEKRVTATLAAIFALRMFGLFMLLPVFTLFAEHVEDATPQLIGTAIGAYGLLQAIFQIPFGALSDRFGRRPMLVAGLILFVIGGVVAATADSIYGIIVGRALQGAGAVASVIMALISDVVTEAHRTRAMAAIGMTVGGSFVLALILGPVLGAGLGLHGLFWLTSALGAAAVVLALRVPAPQVLARPLPMSRGQRLQRVLLNGSLMRLNAGILVLHLVMTCSFVVLPPMLADQVGLPLAQHSLVYLGVLVVSFVGMVPLIISAERRGARRIMLLAVVMLALAEWGLGMTDASLWPVVGLLTLFFVAFNLLEALLPSLVGRAAPAGTKGTSMGIYSTCQFLGVFMGGQLGGVMLARGDGQLAFVVCAGLLAAWAVLVLSMRELPRLDNRVLSLLSESVDRATWVERLLAVDGVLEAVVVPEEGVALLKVDPVRLDEVALARWSRDDAQGLQT